MRVVLRAALPGSASRQDPPEVRRWSAGRGRTLDLCPLMPLSAVSLDGSTDETLRAPEAAPHRREARFPNRASLASPDGPQGRSGARHSRTPPDGFQGRSSGFQGVTSLPCLPLTDLSQTLRERMDSCALTRHFVLSGDSHGPCGRFSPPVPGRAERGPEDQDRGVVRPVEPVLEGGGLRLTHRSTLTSPARCSAPGPRIGPDGSRTSAGNSHIVFT